MKARRPVATPREDEKKCARAPAHVDAGRARMDTLRPEVGPQALERPLRAVQRGAFESAGYVGAARPTTRTDTLAASAAAGEPELG